MNRRQFLQLIGLSGATLSLHNLNLAPVFAQAPKGNFTATSHQDPIIYVANRLGFGITPTLHRQIQQIGMEAYIQAQIQAQEPTTSLDAQILDMFPLLGWSAAKIIDEYEQPNEVIRALTTASVYRAWQSPNGLFERMVQFWSDHFNIFIRKGPTAYLKIIDDREVIRKYALGKFPDLLHASAKSPAMLFYLDNALSTQENPNENYARELMELHTLGVNGGYTEQDIKEVARAFTGWTIIPPRALGRLRNQTDAELGEFVFQGLIHDQGRKTVLGHELSAGRGIEDGERVLDILAEHPSTARFISHKLVRHFVADISPNTLVDRVSQTYLQTDGDIRAMLQVIFASDEFWSATPKFKRPMEYLLGLLRALDYQPRINLRFQRVVLQYLDSTGHVPFAWPAPNGYPDVGAYWMNNLLPRWQAPLTLLTEERDGQPQYDALRQWVSESPYNTWLEAIAHYFLGRPLTVDEQHITETYIQSVSDDPAQQAIAAIALLTASPAYQYR